MENGIFRESEVEQLLKRSPKQLQAYSLLSQQMGQKLDAVAWGKKHKMSMSVLDGLIQKGLVSTSMDQVNR